MKKYTIRKNKHHYIVALDYYGNEVFSLKCVNLAHFYCAIHATKQMICGKKGDTSCLKKLKGLNVSE